MRVHLVDAFTDRPFAGNPAAVCLLPPGAWPDDRRLQRTAAELNQSETAFALPLPARAEADWAIRWFTPRVESRLCGHATLATAHVLRTERRLTGTVRFLTRHYGVLVTRADRAGTFTLDFPAAPGTPVPVPAGLAAALGAEPEGAFRSAALGDLLVVLPDEAAVRALAPDPAALAGLTRREGLRGVIVTAAATAAATAAGPGAEYDFVSRFFAPDRGIPEDPVTGSAHTVLAPYWSARLGRSVLAGFQASARGGLVRTALHGDRVHLTGAAVTVLDATLHGPAPTPDRVAP
ncbi:PhzF family phenazine biosynthesis protein [Streptomyces sp. NPDC093225]|uniref:PhzF family phenazine biosynthesis protein n=1 Tax=Streptomyces sp. NPDC093225 TaxID=3366034 RepID=UPI0037FA3E1C